MKKIEDMIEEEFVTSINSYNHNDSVQKAISLFNLYKASNVTIDLNGKKDDNKRKLSDGKEKSNNYVLKH